MGLDNPVYQIRDMKGNLCAGNFDNLEDLLDTIELIDNLANITIEYVPLTNSQLQ